MDTELCKILSLHLPKYELNIEFFFEKFRNMNEFRESMMQAKATQSDIVLKVSFNNSF